MGTKFSPTHPPIIFKEDKGDIQDFVLDWVFWLEKWKFHLCEPEQRGDLVGLGNFPTHPIPYDFSSFIREIFKILAWELQLMGKKGNSTFLAHNVYTLDAVQSVAKNCITSISNLKDFLKYHL